MEGTTYDEWGILINMRRRFR